MNAMDKLQISVWSTTWHHKKCKG